jgi:hypothetical protein
VLIGNVIGQIAKDDRTLNQYVLYHEDVVMQVGCHGKTENYKNDHMWLMFYKLDQLVFPTQVSPDLEKLEVQIRMIRETPLSDARQVRS